jgi:PAS domain S-box-containing protein
LRALVYDDDPVTRHWLEAALRCRQHEVVACADAELAREAIASFRPSLVILDWSGTHGRDLCGWTRSLPKGQEPLILAAGLSDRPSELHDALEGGADDYLFKEQDAGTLDGRLAVAERRVGRRESRAASECALRHLQKAVESLPLGVSLTDMEGRILYANPSEARMHGYEAHDLMGQEARVFQGRESWRSLKGPCEEWQRERLQVRKDGTIFPARLLSAVATDESGAPLGLVTTCEDLTPIRRIEEALKKAEALHLQVVESLEGVLASVGSDKKILSLNPAFEALTGWPRSAWIGVDVLSLVHPEDASCARRLLARGFSGATPRKTEIRVRTSSGRFLVWECSVAPGHNEGALLIARDVSEHKRRLQAATTLAVARRMLEGKSLLAAGSRLLNAFCVGFSFEAGLLWVPETAGSELACRAAFVIPASRVASAPRGLASLRRGGLSRGPWAEKTAPLANENSPFGPGCVLLIPLLADGELLGALELWRGDTPQPDPALIGTASELGERLGELLAARRELPEGAGNRNAPVPAMSDRTPALAALA